MTIYKEVVNALNKGDFAQLGDALFELKGDEAVRLVFEIFAKNETNHTMWSVLALLYADSYGELLINKKVTEASKIAPELEIKKNASMPEKITFILNAVGIEKFHNFMCPELTHV